MICYFVLHYELEIRIFVDRYMFHRMIEILHRNADSKSAIRNDPAEIGMVSSMYDGWFVPLSRHRLQVVVRRGF